MSGRKPDPELWALIVALHDHCRNHDIALATAARFLEEKSVIVARVGDDEVVTDLLDKIRDSLSMNDPDDDREGPGEVRH